MSQVNYIREHEAFAEYAADNGVSGNECLVWYALMHIINTRAIGSDWPDGFIRIDNRRLLMYCHLSETAMGVARNRLAQRGLIEYEKGRKNASAPLYRMIYPTQLLRPQSTGTPLTVDNDGPIVDNCDFYPAKNGKTGGKTGGKSEGKTPDIISKQYANVDGDPEKDMDDEEDEDVSARADVMRVTVDAFPAAFGRMCTPAEAQRITMAAVQLSMSPEMVAQAINRAASMGARAAANYVIEILSRWAHDSVHWPEQIGEWAYYEDVMAGRMSGTGDPLEDLRLKREAEAKRRARWEEAQHGRDPD